MPIIKTPRKKEIKHFTKKQNSFQACEKLRIQPTILFHRQFQFHSLIKITAGKVNIDFAGDKGFHILLSILLLLSDRMVFMYKRISQREFMSQV